ncbi:MAG: SRPBCC domain-containing protein [Acidimicrobiales bacterium]
MTVTAVTKDPEARTMTMTAEFSAAVDAVWQLWADPRKLEQWWGPPTWPATFVEHDLAPGAEVTYYMTGPDGSKAHGWWRIVGVDAPRSMRFEDGFGLDDGTPNPDMPVMVMQLELRPSDGGGTTMTLETAFPSVEAMEQILAMGMDEGLAQAMGQMDALLG